MKLLLISPYPVFPLSSGGKIRIVQLARNFCQLGMEVTIVTPFHFTQRRSLFIDEPFTLHQVKYPFLFHFLAIDRPFPYGFLTSFHPGLATMMRNYFRGYDIYQFEHVQFVGLSDLVPEEGIVIYDAHNVEYDYILSECRGAWTKSIAGRRVYSLEEKMIARAAHTFVVSKNDQEQFASLYGTSTTGISLAPNGIEKAFKLPAHGGLNAFRRFPKLQQFERRAIYSGSNVAHNRVAVQFIIQELAPALPDYAFIINGLCCKRFAHQTLPNVFFDLNDQNFVDYVMLSTVGLNPIKQGSGVNMKVLNYLNYRLPVVTTPFGMRGYENLKSYITVCPLGNFESVLRRGAFAALPPVSELIPRYTWRGIASHMKDVYRELLNKQ